MSRNEALKAVFSKIGWFVNEDDYERRIAEARRTLADPAAHANVRECATLIVAAADGTQISNSPAPQPSHAESSVEPVLLGTTADGKSVFDANASAEFWLRCAALTPTGEKVKERLIAAGHAPLTARAKDLSIDVDAVLAAAKDHKVMGRPADPVEALKGEIAMQEAAKGQPTASHVRGL
jgi:hypothetical protein